MRVLITGATGLIGKRIVALCHTKGIAVNYLTRSKEKLEDKEDFRGFLYNPPVGKIDFNCLNGVQAIINLAGENVFKPWIKKNRKKIKNSRLDVADVLFNALKARNHQVTHFISASGITIYPSSPKKMYAEDEKAVNSSFLGKVVEEWEVAANKFETLGIKVITVRTGIVLSKKGGALPVMEKPFKFNLGAAQGNGRQWQSWIHIEDMAGIYLFLLEHGLQGTFNAVAPNPVTNQRLTKAIGNSLGKKIWLPNVPAFGLKLVLGEMASVALDSQLVSSKKIQDAGYVFKYSNLARALKDLNH